MVMKNLALNAEKPKGLWGRLMLKRMNKRHLPLINWGLESVDIGSRDKILDIGCGSGNAIRVMLSRSSEGRIYGVDHSNLSVSNALKLNRRAVSKGRVKILEASVADLPFKDNSFDLVSAFETIYFWPDLEENLNEVRRVVKPGGKLLVVCEIFKGEQEKEENLKIVDMLNFNDNYKTREELETLLQGAGFKSVCSAVDKCRGWITLLATK